MFADEASLGLYVINLDRSSERWETISRHLRQLPWPLARVSAYDAKKDPDAILRLRDLNMLQPPDGVGWNPYRYRMFSIVEEACFCSHLAALKQFLTTTQSHAIIFEDDAEPRRALEDELRALINCGASFDAVKLEGIRHQGARLAIKECDLTNSALVRSLRPNSGAAAYLVTRAGAQKLIAHAGKKLLPFDDYLNNGSLYGGIVMHVSPWLFWQAGADQSTMAAARIKGSLPRKRDPWHIFLKGSWQAALRIALWYRSITKPRLSLAWKKMPW